MIFAVLLPDKEILNTKYTNNWLPVKSFSKVGIPQTTIFRILVLTFRKQPVKFLPYEITYPVL